MSGAGSIKWDASDANVLAEFKDANMIHTLSAALLSDLWHDAVRQSKEPVYVVRFANGIDAEIHISKRPR